MEDMFAEFLNVKVAVTLDDGFVKLGTLEGLDAEFLKLRLLNGKPEVIRRSRVAGIRADAKQDVMGYDQR